MTDRPEDELTPSDWLAAQFQKPADDEPAAPPPTAPPASVPAASAPPVAGTGIPGSVPPASAPAAFQSPLVNPFTMPQAQQYQQPLVPQPAPAAPAQPAPSAPPQMPATASAQPQMPPAQSAPPQMPPAQTPQAPMPAADAAQSGAPGGFAWGLAPGAAAAPASPAPSAAPPAPESSVPPAFPPADHAPSAPPAAPTTPAPVFGAPPAAPVPPAPMQPAASNPPATAAAPASVPAAMPAPVPPPLVEPPAADPAQPGAWAPSFDLPTPAPATSSPPPPPSWEQPTQAISFLPEPTQAMPAPTVVYPAASDDGPSAADLLTAVPAPAAAAGEPAAPTTGEDSALDSLFGEQNFRDYASEPPVVAERAPLADRVNPGHITQRQKVLLWIAGGIVAALALAALFLLGTRLPALTAAAPTPTPTPTETTEPEPQPTVLPVGPVEPGVHAWDELLGGECIDPYNDPWVEEFTVVDCTEPHRAQMVLRGTFAPSAEGVTDDPFPGAEALQGQLSLLCSAPGVIDLAAAGQYPDVQFQGSYPPNEEQWNEGDRTYYCFVSRVSGEPLVGSVAVAQSPPAS